MRDRRYADRAAAGRVLADALRRRLTSDQLRDVVVLALPRGGVPVGRVIADELGGELDVLLVRKVGAPGHRELGIGAIGEGGVEILDVDRIRRVGASEERVRGILAEERAELARRAQRYRSGRPPPVVTGRTVVVVDDGVATGVSVGAALRVLRAAAPACLVLAVPVGPPATLDVLRAQVDVLCCPLRPAGFRSVGEWYRDFRQLDDDEVLAALA